ncbi:MAG: zinc ribbon domain-containing protein [Candidatus Helarchaeota archaeon]
MEDIRNYKPRKGGASRLHNFRHSNSPRGKTYGRLKYLSSRRGRRFGRVNPAYTSQYPAEIIAGKYRARLKGIAGKAWHLNAEKGTRRTGPHPKSPVQKTGAWFHHKKLKKPINADVNAARNIALKYHYYRVLREVT